MADEQNTHLKEAAADDDRPLVDDAVTGRSDDTTLDEGDAGGADDAAVSQDQGWAGTEPTGDEAAQAEQAEKATEPAGDESAVAEQAVEEEQATETEQATESDEVEGEASAASQPDTDVSTPSETAVKEEKAPVPEAEPEEEEEIHMDWYILKVQSNRERSISEALERKMRIEGLDRFFDQVIVPTEKVTEFKGGKKKVVERKLYPGYIVVHMHINDDTWFAVRETSGVGDFTGAGGKPTPMLPHEVARIIQTEEEETAEAPKLDIRFASGDKVKVKEGNFENFEGEVSMIDEASGRVTVMINIFGRSTPVELEYWQIEAV
jgi:transcriptional antiterminator NusG